MNHTQDNQQVQAMVGEYGGIDVIIKLLKNGVYEPKKTACVCLS